jgi:hypothetical protein
LMYHPTKDDVHAVYIRQSEVGDILADASAT